MEDIKVEDASSLDGSSGSGTEKVGNLTPFEIFHGGKAGTTQVSWNDPTLAPGKRLVFQATSVGRLPKDIEGNPMGLSTITQIMESPNGAVLAGNKVFFGENEVGLTDMNNIVYDGTDAARVYMPTKNGAPNYNRLQEFEEVKQEADSHKGDWSVERTVDFYREHGFNVDIDNNYKITDKGEVKPFLIAYGYTTDETQAVKGNEKIKALSGDEKDLVYDGLMDFYKKNKIDVPTGTFYTNLYKGTIAIPYSENAGIIAPSMARNITSPKTSIVDARIAKEKAQSEGVRSNNTNFLTN